MSLPMYDLHTPAKPARLLIVNNSNVGTRQARMFSTRDAATLIKGFTDRLGMSKEDRVIFNNSTKADIERAMDDESKNKDLKDYGMLIVVLLSYGYTGHIYGSDNKPVIVDDLMENFRGTNCEAMVGKPKIFIVQACEGDLYQKKSSVEADAGGYSMKDEGTKTCIPSEADFFIMWSPVPGKVAWRDEKSCSPFIGALSTCLKEFPDMEISRLMTRVTQQVCEELERQAPEDFELGGCSLPYMVHLLTKELYFPVLAPKK